jgi:diaminopimelate decarboxylase
MSDKIENFIKNKQLLNGEERQAIIYSREVIESRIKDLKESFPSNTRHCFAIKANPLKYILQIIKKNDMGIECASLGEVMMALNEKFSPDVIVFDSPIKTVDEIKFALEKGVYLNVDNLKELERIKNIRKNIESKSKIGLRINPQIKPGFFIK